MTGLEIEETTFYDAIQNIRSVPFKDRQGHPRRSRQPDVQRLEKEIKNWCASYGITREDIALVERNN